MRFDEHIRIIKSHLLAFEEHGHLERDAASRMHRDQAEREIDAMELSLRWTEKMKGKSDD